MANNRFLLVKKYKNTESAQLCYIHKGSNLCPSHLLEVLPCQAKTVFSWGMSSTKASPWFMRDQDTLVSCLMIGLLFPLTCHAQQCTGLTEWGVIRVCMVSGEAFIHVLSDWSTRWRGDKNLQYAHLRLCKFNRRISKEVLTFLSVFLLYSEVEIIEFQQQYWNSIVSGSIVVKWSWVVEYSLVSSSGHGHGEKKPSTFFSSIEFY